MMRNILFMAICAFGVATSASKIDPKLEHVLNTKGVANVVISFTQNTDQVLQKIDSTKYTTRGSRITSLKSQLEELRASSQESVLNLLNNRDDVQYTSLWINNRIYVHNANDELVRDIAALPQVAEVREEAVVELSSPVTAINSSILAEWGIEKIEAPEAWALTGGNNGAGAVVATIDTGVRYTHEALHNNYRSEYGWYDPYTGSASPNDPSGHGTHVMGTLVGSNGIGVAPGAAWIACRGCSTSSCTEAALNACGQWITCPTLPDGSEPNCGLAPSLVSNSWSGGQGSTWFNPVINAWISAGIVPFFPLGNSGPSCGSANSPGDNINSISVCCTTPSDQVCSFSSRGPTLSGNIKPDICAPGQNIRSSWHTGDTDYNTLSGSSMSTPHVAGTAALLFAHNPNFNLAEIKQFLLDNADQQLGPANPCGGIPSDTFPNNVYGYGRVNARRALEDAIN